ncbi:hypothetical protein [Bradyrhizobium sp.]|jgi:hypothetical protein|uniref:hypothetical protein n=1 Tax=Bradyrhizobium sp. TaxID=376 RepID=UPI003C223BFD
MLSGHQFVKYKPVKNIFGKGPHDDARDENLKDGSHFERRNRQQEHCQQRSNEHFAEKNAGGHKHELGAGNTKLSALGVSRFTHPQPAALDRQLEPETITEPNVDYRGMGEINWRPRASALQQSWAQMLI